LTVRDQNRKSKFENRKSAIENRQSVHAGFVLDAENRVHFALGPYDHTRPLVIDPVLVYSTYLGGSGGDAASGIAVDSSGNAYVTGYTTSSNFPTASPLQSSLAGPRNAFVAKLNWDSSTSTLSLVYSTYLGGSSYDYGSGIAVDSSDNAYVTGRTSSTDFPTAHPYQASLAGGGFDAFVAELNSTGSALVYSTYLGGSGTDEAYGIAVDSSGNAYVTGWTSSSDFPTAYPLQANLPGYPNPFVSKLNWDASTSTLRLVYSTYLGGSVWDQGTAIAVDSSDNAYVTGWTLSSNFPTAHPLQSSLAGGWNTFVAKLNWDASTSTLSLVYSTYLGGSRADAASGIAVDSSGNAYVTGTTSSGNFPTAYPIQASLPGYINAFVSELNWDAPTSTLSLVYSTYLGGNYMDSGTAIAVDSSDDAYVTGYTYSSDFPTAGPLQMFAAAPYSCNAFVTELNWAASTSTLSLVYSTYLGGWGPDGGTGIALDSSGNAYVTGTTSSSNFPTANPLQAALASSSENAFVAKIGPTVGVVPAAAFSPASLYFGNQAFKTTSTAEQVILTSAGTANLESSSFAFVGTNPGDFAQTNNCPGSMAPGRKCTISVTFTPSVLGGESATLEVNDSAAGSLQTVGLSGTGVADATLEPASAGFAWDAINTPSHPETLTLLNNESTALNISSIGFTGPNSADFSQTGGTCGIAPTSLAAGKSCTISVTFTPSVLGWEFATLTVNDNAAVAQYQALTSALSGVGLADATLTPTSYNAGNVAVKTPGIYSMGVFTLTSNEPTALNISSIGFTGANGGDFAQPNGTCGTAPTSLAAWSSCTIFVVLTPSVLGLESATLTVNDSAAAAQYQTLTSALSGTGIADATLTPTSYNFGNAVVKTPSNPQTFTLLNNSSYGLYISSIGFTGANPADFSQTGGTCGTAPTILGGRSACSISVTFTPSVAGLESATLTVNDSAAAAQYQTLTSALSGTGLADATLTPTPYNFGNVAVKTPGSAQILTLQNNESTALNISSIGFTGANGGDFSQTGGTCGTVPTSLGAGKSCTIGVTFTPSVQGLESATLAVNDNAAAAQYQTLTSALSGAGLADATLTPIPYNFGNVAVKTPGSAQILTLQNNESTALNISSIGFTGANSADFSQTGGTCGTAPTSLGAGKSCTISVTFTPSVLGLESATLTVNDNAAVAQYQTLTSALSGAGVADATLGPASYDFGNVAIKEPSNAQTFTLMNNELTALNIYSIRFTGANSADFSQTNTCGTLPASLAGGASCILSVTFTPSVLGLESASLRVNDNAAVAQYRTLTSALSGEGVPAATLRPASYYFGSVAVHTASTPESFILENNEVGTLNIHSIGFTGANGGDFGQTGGTCGTAPTSLAGGTSCTITVTFTPSGTGPESATMTVNDDAPTPYKKLTSSLRGGPR